MVWSPEPATGVKPAGPVRVQVPAFGSISTWMVPSAETQNCPSSSTVVISFPKEFSSSTVSTSRLEQVAGSPTTLKSRLNSVTIPEAGGTVTGATPVAEIRISPGVSVFATTAQSEMRSPGWTPPGPTGLSTDESKLTIRFVTAMRSSASDSFTSIVYGFPEGKARPFRMEIVVRGPPIPFKGISRMGSIGSLEVISRVADFTPSEEGLKVISTSLVASGASRLTEGEFCIENSEASGPVREIPAPRKVRYPTPWLSRMTSSGAVGPSLIFCDPKSTRMGEAVIRGRSERKR